jgi:spore germination cell wall hydrolase CwlJ-like protein
MSYSKMGYYRIITSLVGIILLLILFIAIRPPKIEIKEVIKEIEKEIIIEVEKPSIYVYNVTSMEREMLARLVYLEANTESLECQMGIVSVVINRWQDGRWGDTLEEVIYSPYQFTPANLLYKTRPMELNYTAVDLVLQNGCTLPSYCMYFRTDHHFDWEGYKPYTQIDYTCFGYFEADR